jgi:hypothetical protein
MIIRPIDKELMREMSDAHSEDTVSKIQRTIHIYDKTHSYASFKDGSLKCHCGVIVDTKLLVRDFPEDFDNKHYDRDVQNRISFIKFTHIFNCYIDDNDGNIVDRFRRAELTPIYAIASGYTDTRIWSEYLGDYDKLAFATTIYQFDRKRMSHSYTYANLDMPFKKQIIQLDVCDPRSIRIKDLSNRSYDLHDESCCFEIPERFVGKDLIRDGITKVVDIESPFEKENTFTEQNMIKYSAMNSMGLLPKVKLGSQLFQKDIYSAESLDLIDKKQMLRNLIIDMTKGSLYSLFDSYIMVFNPRKCGFTEVKAPFREFVRPYMEERMSFIHMEFEIFCNKIIDKVGNIRVFFYTNEIETVVKCTFLDSDCNRKVTLRISKLDCIKDYILETGNTMANKLRRFRDVYDLDVLNYYSERENGTEILLKGEL